jgi:hypothetical protein
VSAQKASPARWNAAGSPSNLPTPGSAQQVATAIPLHPTEPVTIDGGVIPFSAPVNVLNDGTGTAEAPSSDAPSTPLVDDVPPPPDVPPSGVTPAEAEAVARIVTMFVAAGIGAGIQKHPELRELSNTPGTPVSGFLNHLDTVLAFYKETVARVLMKYNLRIPFLDEGIVATGFGVAAWGFASRPSEGAKKAAAARAKDANVPEDSPSVQPEPSGEPMPPVGPSSFTVHAGGMA